jgi:hypothetical protein
MHKSPARDTSSNGFSNWCMEQLETVWFIVRKDPYDNKNLLKKEVT